MNPAGWFLPTISSKPCPSPSPPLCSRCHSFLLKSLSSHSSGQLLLWCWPRPGNHCPPTRALTLRRQFGPPGPTGPALPSPTQPCNSLSFPPLILFWVVFPLVGLITRGPLGLLEDWHPPLPADSRLAELPPSLDSGRYPPSPHHRFATTAKIPHEPQRSSPSMRISSFF